MPATMALTRRHFLATVAAIPVAVAVPIIAWSTERMIGHPTDAVYHWKTWHTSAILNANWDAHLYGTGIMRGSARVFPGEFFGQRT